MNKDRKKRINDIVYKIDKLKNELDSILSEEQFYYENIPENLLSSERAEISEEAIENMENSIDLISEILDNLGGI